MKPKKLKINPPVKKGDRVILLHMKGETITPGLKGVVTNVNNIYGEDIISVDWENGSKLSLLSTEDAWTLDMSERIQEDRSHRDKWWIENLDIRFFNTRLVVTFLTKLRDSGVINMFGAAPFLYMGKERIEHEYKYKDVPDEDVFEEVLNMADEMQTEMINGCIRVLERENKETSLENINRYLDKYSKKLLLHYIHLLS